MKELYDLHSLKNAEVIAFLRKIDFSDYQEEIWSKILKLNAKTDSNIYSVSDDDGLLYFTRKSLQIEKSILAPADSKKVLPLHIIEILYNLENDIERISMMFWNSIKAELIKKYAWIQPYVLGQTSIRKHDGVLVIGFPTHLVPPNST
jgi:hypothetical protein